MTWADRLARVSEAKHAHAKTANIAKNPSTPTFGNIGNIGRRVFSANSSANDAAIRVQCARCGTPSAPFLAIINPDLWRCDACLPADPNERMAIQAEPALPPLGTLERERLDSLHRATLAGLMAAATAFTHCKPRGAA